MDYNKMINIKRETNVNDNAFAMPPNKKITDTDDGGGSYYGNDIGVEIEDDYSYMIEDESEDTVKSVKLSKELLSYFLNEIKNIAVSLLEPYHTHTFTVSVTDDFKESINRMGVIEPLLIAQSANYGKYEVISGHRRLEAAKAVGLEKLPCRIAREDTPREILDEIMVITNLQRRNTFTKMELARSLRLLNDSRKKQGYRTDIMNSSGTSTKTELAEEFGISVKKLYMLISFTQLINYFAKKVDDNTLPDKIAYCLSNEAMSDAKELVGKLMIDFERDISGIYSNRFSGVDIPEELIQKYTDVLNNLPGRGRIAYAYLPKETKDMVIGMIKEMIMLPKMKSIINDYYSGARSAAEMFDSKETDNGKSEIDRKMRKAAGDLYNRLGNIILKSMLRTLKENNEQRKKDNAEINTKITVDSMVYALNAVSRLFRTQGSAGTVNTAHALIGELSKQAKKDIARQKQDKGHEV